MLIALMPWSPWVCVGFCLLMGTVGLLTAVYFSAREDLRAGDELVLAKV